MMRPNVGRVRNVLAGMCLLVAPAVFAGAQNAYDPRFLGQLFDEGRQAYAKGVQLMAANQAVAAKAHFSRAKVDADEITRILDGSKRDGHWKDKTSYSTMDGTMQAQAFESAARKLGVDAVAKMAEVDKAPKPATGGNQVIAMMLTNYYNQAKTLLSTGEKKMSVGQVEVAQSSFKAAKQIADSTLQNVETYKKTGAWSDSLVFNTIDGSFDGKAFVERMRKIASDAGKGAGGK